MSTITRTSDSETTTPTFIQGYETSYESASITHRLVDGGIARTLMPHLPRTGTLNLYYEVRAEAWDAVSLLLVVDTFTLTDPDVPEVGMLFSADSVSPALEDQTTKLWIVRADYQELPT